MTDGASAPDELEFSRRRVRASALDDCRSAELEAGVSGLPHALQNEEPAAFAWPHDRQLTLSAAPQCSQNFAPALFVSPHLAHLGSWEPSPT